MFLPYIDFTVAREGSSMTLLGMVSYDSATDSIKSTHVDMQFGGGLAEIKSTLKSRLTYF